MKVLILATDIYTRGGIARYTYAFASALAEVLGADNVDLLALLANGDPSDLQPLFRVLGPVTGTLTATAKARYALKALALARNKYDLVACAHLSLAPIAAAIHFLYRTPYWVFCYGFDAWHPIRALRLAALKKADFAIPISRFTAERLEKTNGIPASKMRLLYFSVPSRMVSLLAGPNHAARVPATGRNDTVLLSVGNLNRVFAYKGFDTVIRALPKVLVVAPNARYVIVGEGDGRGDLEKLAAEVGVADRVTFAGQVTNAQLAELYRTCEVFVMPSRAMGADGPASGEGFGGVYVEAALAGKPVVGSREGGAAEAVLHGKTGLLVDPRSADEVAAAVIVLLSDPVRAASMGAEGRKWAMDNFTQEALRRRLGELLNIAPAANENSH